MITDGDLLSLSPGAYDLIVVPYLPLLSVAHQNGLLNFAKKGGTLLVLGKSGARNEYNLPHKQAALANALGGSYPRVQVAKRLGEGQIIFVPVEIPANRFLIPMKSKGEYTTFGPTMADLFPDIPEGYTRNRIDPALRQILDRLAGTVTTVLDKRITRLLSPAPYVELTTMLDRGRTRILLHAVNYDVTLNGDITPARGLKVQLALPNGKTLRSIYYSGTLGEMRPVKWTGASRERRSVVFELDQVDVYGLAVIELDKASL
jgi:hypothetical protein